MNTPDERDARRERARLAELERMKGAKVREVIGTSIFWLFNLLTLITLMVAIYGGLAYAVQSCESSERPGLPRGR